MSNTSLASLLDGAGLDAGTSAAMALTADNLGPAITAGLGQISLDDIAASEVVLVTLLLDDSSSIQFAGNTQAVREAHNLIVEALRAAKQSGDVLISCRYLNDGPFTDHGVLYAYRPLDGAPLLDTSNYDPRGGTPLYDQTAATLTGVAAKLAEFEAGGVGVRAITVIVTDGADQHSHIHRDAADVQPILTGLLATEQHLIMAMGIDDGATNFRNIFGRMGVPDKLVLTPGNTPSEIRAAAIMVSQSVAQASQSPGSFSQTAFGGFGT